MLEKQSLGDFISRINSNKTVIVSVSPQSRASLAAFFGFSQSQVTTFFAYSFSTNYFFQTIASHTIRRNNCVFIATTNAECNSLTSGSQETDCFVQVDGRKGCL
jgi:iron only hydrogenase large subunit-like protein